MGPADPNPIHLRTEPATAAVPPKGKAIKPVPIKAVFIGCACAYSINFGVACLRDVVIAPAVELRRDLMVEESMILCG